MHAIEALLSRPEVERLGWVLLHFLWQGAIGAAVVAAALFAMRRASANARYLVACGVLLAMAACLPVTWLVVPQRSSVDRSAITAMESVGYVSTNATKVPIRRIDGVVFVEPREKSLDEPLAKRQFQTDQVIDAQPALPTVVGMTWQQRIAVGLPWLAVVWLGGVLILSLRLAIGWSAVRRLRREALRPADDSRQAVLSRLSRQLEIRWPVKLLESAVIEVPTMIGWLRPAILWPPSVLAGLSVEQFESLLAHELAHVRRHDYLVNLIETAIETLLFYHPAIWWVSSRIRQERECCCDDLAVATCGNRISYARALTALEELRPRPRQFALAADGGRLLLRIRRIIGQPAPPRSGSRHWLLGIALSGTALALIAALGLSNLATGDEPAEADPAPASLAAEPAKPGEQPKSRIASTRLPCDLEVRRILDSDATELLPQSLGDRIKKIPHVTAVSGWLGIDSPPGYGVPFDSPLMKEPKIIAGRMLAAGDRHKVIVGKLWAEKRSLKVGDTMKVYGTDVEIVGIFEHPRVFWNIGTIALLPDLQELMHAERQVSEFLVEVDIPEDGTPDEQAQFADVCKQIEEVGYDLKATGVAPPTATSLAPPTATSVVQLTPPVPSSQISPPATGVDDANPSPQQRIIQISGSVVDDETGKLIPAFHRQIGDIFADQVNWRREYWSEPPDPPGYFSVPLAWTSGDRLRIVAGGYVPEVVLTERPSPDAGEIKGITVRMKRGRKVSGRVVDYQGKPVAGASIFAVGSLQNVEITGGRALVEALVEEPDRWIEDPASVRFTTDSEGRFTVTGIGWDARDLAVCCPALDLWIVPAPLPSQPQTDFEIRLPQPGKLIVHYDIAGAPDATEVALWPWKAEQYRGGATHSLTGPATLEISRYNYQSHVLYGRKVVVKQRGEAVFDNLPPTDYVVERVKRFEDLRRTPTAVLDQSIVKILPGKTTVVDFVRPKGTSVTGQVIGLDRPEVLKTIPCQVFVSVGRANETEGWQPPKYDVMNSTFDVVAVGSLDNNGNVPDGKFTTERLPPGQYRITAKVFDEKRSNLTTLEKRTLFSGDTVVTVPNDGEPPPVTIELRENPAPKPVTEPRAPVPYPTGPVKHAAESPPKHQPNAAQLTRILSGHAVDAETGQPVQGFIYEEANFDEQDPARFHWNGDAISPGSQRDGAFGIVVKNQQNKPVWARIVAPGYVPQPISDKPIVLADDTVLDKFEVRMHRGKELTGRVVDAAGKPVADAGVYLLRNQGRRQVVRDPAVAGPNQQFEMLAITHAATDADGRFKMTGWDAESGRVAVLSGEMNLWVTAIPADTADWTIHLPHPATIECLVDDDRGEHDTLYDLDFLTDGRKGWEMLRAYQFSLRSKDGRLVMANHTPGKYELTRRRRVAVGDFEGEFRLADVKLQVNPSAIFTIDLQHPVGWPIAGQVTGLKELGLSGAVISVEPPGEVKRGAMTFDALSCGEDGRFETSRIPPGKYRVHVDAYLPKKPADPHIFSGGLDLSPSARMPDFTADADVTITKDEQPAKLKLELKKGGESRAFREVIQYHEQPHPAAIDEFTAPPWAVAAPNENPAERAKPNAVQFGDKAASAKANGHGVFELAIVQKTGKSHESNGLLPDELGDRIKKLPHVTAVAGWLYDLTGIDYGLNASVLLVGEPADSPVFENWKLTSGRLLTTEDRHCVIVEKTLAEKLSWEVGTSIKLYDTAVTIIGIYESGYTAESDAITMPLTDMQEFRKLPHQVHGFVIRTDIPKDGSQERLAQVADLKKQIVGLKDGIVAIEPPSADSQASAQPANGAKPAEKPKPTDQRDTVKKAHERDGRDLIVQKLGESAELNNRLPEDLGDRIKAIPHVTAVSGGLMDVVSFPEHELTAVIINGLLPGSPFFAEWKLKSGRLPKAGDHAKAIVGVNLAKTMKINVRDKIKIYDSDVEVIGIFESKNVLENGSMAILLSDLQKFMDRPKQVTGFIVGTDVSREDSPENRTIIAELRKRIEALGEGIAAIEKPSEIHREMSKSYERTRFGDQAKSPLTLVSAPAAAPAPESNPFDVHGQVLDDATGKPIPLFDVQGGHVDPKDATKTSWGYYLRPNAGGVEGRFDANIDWNAGWRARIIASGYLPQPILTEPPKAGQTKSDGLMLRMKRGREVSGRVVDHAGQPVKDAALFVVGSRPMEITGGQALMDSSQGVGEDRSAGRYSTDADGRFTLTGIGEDAMNVAVSCRAVDLWIVPAPSANEAAKGFEIRLPEPGKLIVHYDIPGGPEEATIFLQLHTWDRDGWKGVDNRRRPTVKQHGELVLDNMAPGLYEVVRDSGGFLDRRQVTIEPGKTVTTDFIRKAGAAITGRVVGLDREDVQKAKPAHIIVTVHKPGDERNPIAPKFAAVRIEAFDKDGKPSDGSFKTELIPPGEYLVRASVFIEETPEQRLRTGIIPPGFEGEATATVPEQGAPPPVKIELKKWEYKAPENPQPKKDAIDAAKKNAVEAAVNRGVKYLAQQQSEKEAAAKAVPDEVAISIPPALAAELRALDAMRAGTSTNFEKVDEMGEKLLDRFHEPDERGQIYYALLQVHGQSGLVTPEHIIEYAKRALNHRLGSRQELMVYIYWGDTLNVRKTEKPWSEQRIQAAFVYLSGLRRLWEYNVPEQPPELPAPPPRYDGPEGPEREAAVAAMKHYMELKNKADFIKELIYRRQIFIRQIADMYHRRPATHGEIEALRQLAKNLLANETAVDRLMAAVEADPKKAPEQKAAEQTGGGLTKLAIEAAAGGGVLVRSADRQFVTTKLYIDLGKGNGGWSKPVGGLQAGLSIERGRESNGTPILATYLELRNVSDSASPIEIAVDPSKIEFTVTDSKGKEVPQAVLPYDGISASPGTLRVPHDSQLRLGVSGKGAGIPKDQGALLDLASSAVWLFQRGDTGEYNLHAKFTIPKTGDHVWHGTIDVPAARIPLNK